MARTFPLGEVEIFLGIVRGVNLKEQTARPLNLWDDPQVKRAEKTWGNSYPKYTRALYNFAIKSGRSYLDLGCGFGRFLQYLIKHHPDDEFEYVGYDSSPFMIARIITRFPEYGQRCFVRNITDPIIHSAEVIVASAVFIHIPVDHQDKILSNINNMSRKPLAIGFDINCPDKKVAEGRSSFETIMQPGFRMTWQDPDMFAEMLAKKMPLYNFTSQSFDIGKNRLKYVFFLTRKEIKVDG